MTQVICTHDFYGAHRKVDFPTYDAACDELTELHQDGAVNGDFIVQFGDRQGESSVFATVWRSVAVEAPGWSRVTDAGSTGTEYKYSRGFNPAVVSPEDVVAETRALLLTQPSN